MLPAPPTEPGPEPAGPVAGLTLEPVPYSAPEVQAMTAEVQEHYRQLYGGTDDSPLDGTDVTPPEGGFLLGRLDGAPVAMGGWRRVDDVTAYGSRRVAELRRMYVVPTARRSGIARALLAALEQEAADAGVEVVVLSTGAPQTDALDFYRACGYAEVPAFGFYAGYSDVRCLARRIVG